MENNIENSNFFTACGQVKSKRLLKDRTKTHCAELKKFKKKTKDAGIFQILNKVAAVCRTKTSTVHSLQYEKEKQCKCVIQMRLITPEPALHDPH